MDNQPRKSHKSAAGGHATESRREKSAPSGRVQGVGGQSQPNQGSKSKRASSNPMNIQDITDLENEEVIADENEEVIAEPCTSYAITSAEPGEHAVASRKQSSTPRRHFFIDADRTVCDADSQNCGT